MKLYRLKDCCCCCSLRVGALTIGWFYLIAAIINGTGVVQELSDIHKYKYVIKSIAEDLEDCDEDCIDKTVNVAIGISITSLIFHIIMLVCASLLIYGVNKNRPSLLSAFIVDMFVSVVVIGIITIVMLSKIAYSALAAVVICIFMIPLTIATAYFGMVVKSYQEEMREILGARTRLEEEMVSTNTYPVNQQPAFSLPPNHQQQQQQQQQQPQPQPYYPIANQQPAFALPPNQQQQQQPPPPPGYYPPGNQQQPAVVGFYPHDSNLQPAYTDVPPAYSDNPPAYNPAYGSKT